METEELKGLIIEWMLMFLLMSGSMSLAFMTCSYLTLAIGKYLDFLLQFCEESNLKHSECFGGVGGVTISFLKRHLLSSTERESRYILLLI